MSADPDESTQEIKTVPPDGSEPDTPGDEGDAPGEEVNPPPSRDTSDEGRGAPGTAIPPPD